MNYKVGDTIEFQKEGIYIRANVLAIEKSTTYINPFAVLDSINGEWRYMGVSCSQPIPTIQIINPTVIS